MSEELKLVGERIRELRDICGFSVEEIAQKLDITADEYKYYEDNGENIPISALYNLAGIYNVEMTEILSGKSPKLTTLSVVKRGRGIKVERYEGYEYENIAYSFANKTMEPMIVTLNPGMAAPKMVTHSGQEINFCLEGSMFIHYDGSTVCLEAGDCVYFDAQKPHGQSVNGNVPAKFLTVINE